MFNSFIGACIHFNLFASSHTLEEFSRERIISGGRSEEHTSELQSRLHLVCRLLLEKKKETSLLGPSATQSGFASARLIADALRLSREQRCVVSSRYGCMSCSVTIRLSCWC